MTSHPGKFLYMVFIKMMVYCIHLALVFTTKLIFRTVTSKEESCSNNCLDKYLKMTQRVSLRFQEHQLLNAEVNGAPVPK